MHLKHNAFFLIKSEIEPWDSNNFSNGAICVNEVHLLDVQKSAF